MSATFHYEVVDTKKSRPHFNHGTSSDSEALHRIFGGVCEQKAVEKLRAMHMATQHAESLWNDIANVLEQLPEHCELKVWDEY